MIVPVFPADLERNSGMKRAARFLFKTWPGAVPIKHTEALDILARGLGYQSYHDVTKQGSSWTEARPDIDIHSIEWNLSRVLSEEFQAPGNPGVTINLGNLLAYIQTIPLHHLTVFKRFPELLEGRHSFPLLPYDKQSPFGRFQHSPVVPHDDDWRILDSDDDERVKP
ncbi:hypothetical protein [Pseudomonas caspiana]|uniref:hypothetical protein n=1 Tax=Pseudomonas caspiana TaxID=1451454 RepID=UPI0032EF7329